MKWTATFAAAALSAALCAAPTANEDFVVAEAAAAYSNAVYVARTNTAAVADALSASLTSRLSLASLAATNYTDAASAALSAAIPTDNAQLANGAGYVTASVTNGLLKTESDPTVPAWAKAASAPLPPNYATVSNKAMTALQSYTETDPTVPAWAKSATQPLPPDYSNVSNKARNAVQKTGDTMSGNLKFVGGDGQNIGVKVEYHGADDVSTVYAGNSILHNIGSSLSYLYWFPNETGTLALESSVAAAATAATNYTDSAIGAAIAPSNPTFSNAVLAVGLNIDTNAVAVLNEIAADFGGFPLTPGSTATTVGGLLAALAAAVAWLKKNKADAAALRYAFAATIQPTAGTAAPTGTLTDRAEIKVVCTEATGQTDANAKLTLTLPPAVPGYVRDFLVKIDRTTPDCYSVDFVPYGNESVSYETEDGSMPEVPDGAVTWLSFTESESGGVFAVRATPLVAVTGGV